MDHFNEDALMEQFYKWNSQNRKQRFIRRMEHKLYAKEQNRDRKHRSFQARLHLGN